MDLQGILSSSWTAVRTDPLVFITGLLVTWPLVWLTAHLFFRSLLAGKDERIAALKERVDDYEKRLGKSPDEAKQRIEELEKHANLTLGPAWRSLTAREKTRLAELLSDIQSKPRIQIMYSNHRGRSLAFEFGEIFKQAGWTLNIPVGEGAALGFGISTGWQGSPVDEIRAAIEDSTNFIVSVRGAASPVQGLVFLAVGINSNEDGTAPHKSQR